MYMKTLKFKTHLSELILAGEKTTTWRLFDEKNLQTGDMIELVNKETLVVFGTGQITEVVVKTLSTLDDTNWKGHEKFSSETEMYETYREYYGPKVGPDTEVKIIQFIFNHD
jgi:hypothetical protein